MTTKRLSAAEQSVDRHYALHMSHENDADWICPACGPSEKTLSAVEFWKSSMRWSDKMNEKEACEFAEAYNAALRSQLVEVGRKIVEQAGEKLTLERDLATAQHEFQNFHRSLCERFGYAHDPIDWKRDQASLEEHIASMVATAQARIARLEKALRDAGNANGTPIADYYSPQSQLQYHHERTDKVARIIEQALAEPQSGSE